MKIFRKNDRGSIDKINNKISKRDFVFCIDIVEITVREIRIMLDRFISFITSDLSRLFVQRFHQ
jgi:hypothetical protein